MAVIRFDSDHKINVEESVQEIHEKIVAAGATYPPLIQAHLFGDENSSTINAHTIRTVTEH